MQRPQPPTEPCRDADASRLAVYDWGRFGRHRLRVPAGVLIDSPLPASAVAWLGTLWPDDPARGGWARMIWERDRVVGRGWNIPARLAGGDVVEFGADQSGRVVRWYGIVDTYDAVEWLTLQGPYPDPAAAQYDADRRLAEIRFQPPPNRSAHQSCARSPRHRHR
jgi:hypothetical protein